MQMYNPGFKPVEFDGFRKQAGLNSFTMTPKKWIETTGDIVQNPANMVVHWRDENPKADGNIRDSISLMIMKSLI